jgi:uncharacterized membrane protein
MKPLAEFTKTTLVGGLLIILPIYVALLLLLKAVKGLLGLLDPVASRIPTEQFRGIAAILLLVIIRFVVGIIVRTRSGLRARSRSPRPSACSLNGALVQVSLCAL